jgi:hypothetical protein
MASFTVADSFTERPSCGVSRRVTPEGSDDPLFGKSSADIAVGHHSCRGQKAAR